MKRKVNMNNLCEKRVNPRLQLDLNDTEESPTSESLGGTKIYKWIIQKKLSFSKPKTTKVSTPSESSLRKAASSLPTKIIAVNFPHE